MPTDSTVHYFGTLAVDASSLVTIPVARIGAPTSLTIPIPPNKQLLLRTFGLESTFDGETRVELQYAADGVTFSAIRSWNLPAPGELDEDFDGVGVLSPEGSDLAALRFQAIQSDDTAVRLSISVEIQTNNA